MTVGNVVQSAKRFLNLAHIPFRLLALPIKRAEIPIDKVILVNTSLMNQFSHVFHILSLHPIGNVNQLELGPISLLSSAAI